MRKDAVHHRQWSRTAVLIVAGSALAFTAGAAFAPWARSLYAPVCHQLPDRCLTLGGLPLGVCARCLGLYIGGILGLVASLALPVSRGRRPRPHWLALAVAPTLVDGILPWVGRPGLPNVPRLLLAVPAGLVAGVFLAAGIFELGRELQARRTREATPATFTLEESDG